MRLQSVDTTPQAEKMQMELLRLAGPQRRMQLLRNLSATTRRLSRNGLQKLHPNLKPSELNLLFLQNLYGRELQAFTGQGQELALLCPNRSLQEHQVMNDDILAAIEPLVAVFEKLGIAYLIGGSVASSALGLPRSTLDADLVADLQLEQVSSLVEALGQDYYLAQEAILDAIQRHSSFKLIHLQTMFKLDIFVIKPDLFDQIAFSRRQLLRLDATNPAAREFYLSSPEDILLHKLAWYKAGNNVSERQWLDVLGLLKVRGDTINREYLKKWANDLSLSDLLEQSFEEAGLA